MREHSLKQAVQRLVKTDKFVSNPFLFSFSFPFLLLPSVTWIWNRQIDPITELTSVSLTGRGRAEWNIPFYSNSWKRLSATTAVWKSYCHWRTNSREISKQITMLGMAQSWKLIFMPIPPTVAGHFNKAHSPTTPKLRPGNLLNSWYYKRNFWHCRNNLTEMKLAQTGGLWISQEVRRMLIPRKKNQYFHFVITRWRNLLIYRVS